MTKNMKKNHAGRSCLRDPERSARSNFKRSLPAAMPSPVENMQQYAQHIEKVRAIAVSHTLRCGGNPEEMKQTFLFTGDHYVGVQFKAGAAEAKWIFGNRLIELMRSGEMVARMSLEDSAAEQPVRRAA